MLRNFITIFFALLFSISFAQVPKKATKALTAGQSELLKNNLDKAIQYFNKAIAAYPDFKEAYLSLYTVYLQKNDGPKALNALEHATKLASKDKANLLYNTARLSLEIGEYQKCLTYTDQYLNLNSKDEATRKMATLFKIKSEYSLANQSLSVPHSTILLPKEINTLSPEYLPSLDASLENLVFTRRTHGNEDLYIAKKEANDSLWHTAISWPLNTPQNEGAHTISADGKAIVFTRCNMNDGLGGCDLYISEYKNNSWTKPRNMGTAINTTGWESQPSLSPDGRELYFTSTREGGFGASDIWKSVKKNNTWTKPINLGKSINTEWDESSPCIHADKKTLYFRSTGWPGYGSFDLYLSRLNQANEWSIPVNLGYPINDYKDQGAMVVAIDGHTAYYSDQIISLSNQLIESNIVQFSLPKEKSAQACIFIKGTVKDKMRNSGIPNALLYFESTDGYTRKDSILSDPEGAFLLVLPSDRSYQIYVTAMGYTFYSDRLPAHGSSIINYDVILSKWMAADSNPSEKPIVLKNVLFKTGSSILEEESFIELNEIAKYLINHPDISAEILGHTDNAGNQDINRVLSVDRAKAVVQYLVQQGVKSKKLTYEGYGDSIPIASNETAEGRALNRRVEINLRAE